MYVISPTVTGLLLWLVMVIKFCAKKLQVPATNSFDHDSMLNCENGITFSMKIAWASRGTSVSRNENQP